MVGATVGVRVGEALHVMHVACSMSWPCAGDGTFHVRCKESESKQGMAGAFICPP